jgi:hypothetical protein
VDNAQRSADAIDIGLRDIEPVRAGDTVIFHDDEGDRPAVVERFDALSRPTLRLEDGSVVQRVARGPDVGQWSPAGA